jgi:hypothetical protein
MNGCTLSEFVVFLINITEGKEERVQKENRCIPKLF